MDESKQRTGRKRVLVTWGTKLGGSEGIARIGAVRMIDVATPLTFWNMARSWRGAYEGWLPSADAMLHHVPKQLPGLANFYMAGQWVEPGGGVPIAVMSGRQVVQLLCKNEARPFEPPRADVGEVARASS